MKIMIMIKAHQHDGNLTNAMKMIQGNEIYPCDELITVMKIDQIKICLSGKVYHFDD